MLDFDHRMPRRPEVLAVVRGLEETIAAQDRLFGPDDPRTVGSRLRLVEAYEDLAIAGDDRDLDALMEAELAKAVDSRLRTLGSDHPDTLDVQFDLTLLRFRRAVQYGLPGQDELVDEFRSIGDTSARTLGAAHRMTLKAWAQSAFSSGPERSALKARIVQGWEELLADHEQRLGPDDPETLETMERLLAQYRDDHPEAARRLGERLTAGWGRVAAARTAELGPVHPETATARDQHLRLVDEWITPGAGEHLFEELVADHLRLLGPDHPRTLHTQLVLLRYWKGLPAYATPETLALAEQLLDRFLEVLGPHHDDFLMLRYHLMSHHAIKGSLEAALDLKRRYPTPDDEEQDDNDEDGATH
jgi:hypothetical protein